MCILMVFGFLTAWTPYASFAAWIFFNKGAAFTATAMAIPAFFSKASALFNPIIYVLMNKQVSMSQQIVVNELEFSLNLSFLSQLTTSDRKPLAVTLYFKSHYSAFINAL